MLPLIPPKPCANCLSQHVSVAILRTLSRRLLFLSVEGRRIWLRMFTAALKHLQVLGLMFLSS